MLPNKICSDVNESTRLEVRVGFLAILTRLEVTRDPKLSNSTRLERKFSEFSNDSKILKNDSKI